MIVCAFAKNFKGKEAPKNGFHFSDEELLAMDEKDFSSWKEADLIKLMEYADYNACTVSDTKKASCWKRLYDFLFWQINGYFPN